MKALPPQMRDLIVSLVRTDRGHTVSTGVIMTRMRAQFPHLPLPAEDLRELIVIEAARTGRSVEFDERQAG